MPITQPTKVTNRDSGELFDDQSNSSASKNISSNSSTNTSTEFASSDLRVITAEEIKTLSHFEYDPNQDQLIADRAIETTLNSLFLGEQHKMSSGSENIFFTNLTSDINFFPMWGGLKDQSVTANQGASGFIPPSGRIFSDMFSLPLGGNPDPTTSTGYAGDNYFGVNISGLGITTVAAEDIDSSIRLEYRIEIAGKNVYKQVLPRNGQRSNVNAQIYAGDTIEWFFDHPVDVRAGTTLYAEIQKVRNSDDADLGIFQVRQGDAVDPNTGLYRYQATVHNRLFEDKDLELISPYLKYKTMDFGLDSTGSTILLRDLSLGSDSLLVPHAVNTLEAVAVGTEIKIKLKDGAKIIVESLPVNGVTVNGAYVNSVLNQAVIELNAVFTNTAGFVSPDTFVDSFTLTGNDLTLGLNDGVSYTVDVTSLGVDENNFVASGALSGTDLILTMDDATTVTVDASSLAVDEDTTISFGTLVGNSLTLTASDSSTVTVDVSALAVDENLHVVSGTLNGTDIDLTMSDASVITVDAVSLGIDNNTTVTGGSVSGTNINLSLSDASIITIDASTLSTGSSNEVVSGSVVGTDLVLVMSDASTITIDATNMINGSTNISTNSGWHISYGTNANQAVGTSTNDSTVFGQLPFYFGESLTRGSEFKWNFNSNGGANLILGIWDGAESATAYNGGSVTQSNWNTAFTYAGGFIAGSNVGLTTTTAGSNKYVVGTGDALSLRFHLDGHLELMDISSGAEIEIAKTLIPLNVTEFNIQMHTWANGVLPNGMISSSDFIWDIVHDYANTEAGVLNGVLTHTILKRNLALSPGEKYMIPLQKQGAGETFGIDYTGASTGNVTAEDNLLTSFKYQTNESIIADINWNHNTSSTRYFLAGGGAGIPSWRQGGAGTMQGLFSLRYLTDNTLQIWSETYNELVASSVVHPDGSDIYLYFGVNGNTNYSDLPNVTKQLIGQGSQPLPSFQPTAANQTVTVTEGDALNFQIVTSDNIVNQFGESDAPSWITLNQSSGILSGTAPTYTGTSADTIIVNCKAGNAIGGTVDFTVTVTVSQAAASYSNTQSIKLTSTSGYLQGNASNVTALQRASNGSGSGDAWTINMWIKPANDSNVQTLFYYGGDSSSKGAFEISQQNTNQLVFSYGNNTGMLVKFVSNILTPATWQMITITYSGAITGNNPSDLATYLDSFAIYVDGVVRTSNIAQVGGGYTGSITSDLYRIGRGLTGQYAGLLGIDQIAIYDSEKTSGEVTSIYNSGATQDLTSTSPAHLYEFGSSITTVTDTIGNADLTAYNLVSSDIITDTP